MLVILTAMYINVDVVDIIYHVQPWCSTGDVYVGWNWGFCSPDCVMHEDTFTWRIDKTVKMTVQYNYNPALWAGLELYGIILPWIVFIGLILTVILPITGKVTMQPGVTTIVIII